MSFMQASIELMMPLPYRARYAVGQNKELGKTKGAIHGETCWQTSSWAGGSVYLERSHGRRAVERLQLFSAGRRR